ncbi:glycosyltransferase family 4 protein [Kamptonema formosum]|uniref:glycosyltransferase family 4 protein n=1 Tax=Kamptonema formosum TaxID=331992 RepID=UPI0003462DA1|nr:glycosyltransferase family 4 protein [Oscillatoria sp. PCC 10802]
MKYHLALGRPADLESIARDAAAGICPRHVMWALSRQLGATVHQPGAEPVLPSDRIRSQIASRPEHWALARTLSEQLTSDDLIYCTGEDIGIPVAALCGAKPDRPKIAVTLHNIDRPRGRVALKLFRLAQRTDLFLPVARPAFDFLRRSLRLPESRIRTLPEQTDTTFFTPGPPSPDKRRPVIASAGLEMRDCRTLAEATQDLEVDVKISGFSRDARASARAFPKTLPANMSRRFYSWPELVQLYRDADVVAISLTDSKSCAGITTLLEAMACRRPVVVTRTRGLADYLATPGAVTAVNPGDPAGLRQAILRLLNNPQEAQQQAERGYELAVKHHNSERYVGALTAQLALL